MTAAEQFLSRFPEITDLPRSYTKLAEALESPNCTTGILSRIISEDNTLISRLLKMINCPLFGFPHKIQDIPQALVVLDSDQLRDLVEISSIIQLFNSRLQDRLLLRDFWKFSLASSLSAKVLAATAGRKCSERLFAAAFLFGIGKLAMVTGEPDKMREAGMLSIKNKKVMQDAEKEIFGFNHCDLGSIFLKKWNSPRPVIDISLHYHQPALSASYKTESHIVRLAVTIIQSLRIGSSGDHYVLPVLEDTWKETGLKPSVISNCVTQVRALYKPVEKAFLG